MNMTKEYEMEQISLAIAYIDERLEKECIRMEADKIRKTIKNLSGRYKELNRGEHK